MTQLVIEGIPNCDDQYGFVVAGNLLQSIRYVASEVCKHHAPGSGFALPRCRAESADQGFIRYPSTNNFDSTWVALNLWRYG